MVLCYAFPMEKASKNHPRMKIMTEWLQILLGLIVFAYGVHLTINANIGLGPWDCLGMGISYHTPLNFGLSMTLVSVCLLIVDLLMKEKIGYGTIIDALVTGNLAQFYNTFDPLPQPAHLTGGIVMMLAGVTIMAFGQFLYMRSAHGCGPRDSFLVGLGKRLHRLPIGAVQVIVLAIALLFGWLLGGQVGIGTLINVFGTGVMMQIVFRLLRFEPRQVAHRSVIPVSKTLFTTHYPGTDRSAYGAAAIIRVPEYFSHRYRASYEAVRQARVPLTTMPNTLISGRGVTKNCSVAAVTRVLFFWKQQGVIETEDTIQQIYRNAERIAIRHGYRENRGLRAIKIDDLSRDLLREYGMRGECRGVYGWDFEKDLMPEIDAGRPVILNIAGGFYHNHTVTVIGYQICRLSDPEDQGVTGPDAKSRTGSRIKRSRERIILTIADGWKALPRYLDLSAFQKEFPAFGISSINLIRNLTSETAIRNLTPETGNPES